MGYFLLGDILKLVGQAVKEQRFNVRKNVNYFMWTDQVKKIKLTQYIENDDRMIDGFQEMLLIPSLSFYVQNKASNYGHRL